LLGNHCHFGLIINFSSPINTLPNPCKRRSTIVSPGHISSMIRSSHRYYRKANLQDTRLDDGWLLVVVDLSAAGSGSLESLDDSQGLLISDLTEDNVLAIEPAGDNGGNEELGAVGVWSGVGHGEKSWLGVLSGEVLIGELLTVDGLATSAVATGEVTSLEHELRDNAVEGRASVSETLLAGAESAEVLSSLWDNVIVEVEVDAAGLLSNL